MAGQRSSVSAAQADLERIRIKLSNVGAVSSRNALTALRAEAKLVMGLARRFAPHKTGLLDDEASWKMQESRTGINGRTEFTISLNNSRWQVRGGKRVTLAMYAKFMQNGWGSHRPYNLGKGSRDKADGLGLSQVPNGSGHYVGWRFLSRALKVRRLQIETKVSKAVREAIR